MSGKSSSRGRSPPRPRQAAGTSAAAAWASTELCGRDGTESEVRVRVRPAAGGPAPSGPVALRGVRPDDPPAPRSSSCSPAATRRRIRTRSGGGGGLRSCAALLVIAKGEPPRRHIAPAEGAAVGMGAVENRTLVDPLLNGTGAALPATEGPPATEEPDLSSVVESFLYSGDPAVLAPHRCSRGYRPAARGRRLPGGLSGPLGPAVDGLANAANFLNLVFQASDLREASVAEDMEWYHGMTRALLETQPLVRRALLTFDAEPDAPAPQLVLLASRGPGFRGCGTILLQDRTRTWGTLHPPGPAGRRDDAWFSGLKFPPPDGPSLAAMSKRTLLNDLATLDTPKWGRGDSYVTNRSGVWWADAPFLECEDGRFLPAWLLTLGVIRVDVDIQSFDVDQCAVVDGWFADTHQCNRTSMEVLDQEGMRSLKVLLLTSSPEQVSMRSERRFPVQLQLSETCPDAGVGVGAGGSCYPSLPICLPCWPGCAPCQDGRPCRVQEDWVLRSAMMAAQGAFMVLIFISMATAYRHRRSKRIRASGLLLLETILFGSLLLYFPSRI
ncbi:hypothetical protein CRUP_001076 [Coryphaenoides rupestris]|nr:hypothetical protein CRUP_001076 [Coryphaenoides rupestris]